MFCKMQELTKQQLKSSPGFTLMELIIVIVIVGILSALSVPRITGLLTSMQMKAAREKILDDLKYIENYAISHHDTTWIVIDQPNNSYALYAGPSAGDRQLLRDPSTNQNAVINVGAMFNGIYISQVNFGGSNEVFFNWYGSPSFDGNIILNQQWVIHLIPVSGYVYESTSLDTPPNP